MFGWLKKKTASREERAAFGRGAEFALSHIFARGRPDHSFWVERGRIDCTNPQEREAVSANFKTLWDQLSKNRENWKGQLADYAEMGADPKATKFQEAAAELMMGIVKTDMLCRMALQFPDDKELSDMAYKVLGGNLGTLDVVIVGPQSAASILEPAPSAELLQELPYASAFFEKRTGW